VERESTRLLCEVAVVMQSTYDPRDIKRIVPGDAYKHEALPLFFGRPVRWDWDMDTIDADLDALLKDASPINHLTSDDPPVFIFHNAGSDKPGDIHHPNFGKHLKEAMDKLHIECVQKLDSDYASMKQAHRDMVEFLKRHLETNITPQRQKAAQ
jgi:hypothetical protein